VTGFALPQPYRFRDANAADVDAIVELVNIAYRVEDFFIDGNRTYDGEVRMHLGEGTFVLAEAPGEGFVGSIFTRIEGTEGYFGMLSVHPDRQHHGVGRALIAEAERRALEARCASMRLVVVNLRDDLIPWYERLGYVERGTAPFAEPDKLKMPAVFVEMVRPLV
jgi:ribosomal protein S18 acetylase RimI-like enzyme